MEIFTYRAASLQEALMLVRHELGPDASVLQTREVGGKFFGLLGKRNVEVQASRDAKVLRRLGNDGVDDTAYIPNAATTGVMEASSPTGASPDHDYTQGAPAGQFDLSEDDDAFTGLVFNGPSSDWHETDRSPLARTTHRIDARRESAAGSRTGSGGSSVQRWSEEAEPNVGRSNHLSPAMFEVFTELLDWDVDPDAARQMLQEVALHSTPQQLNDPWLIKGRLCQLVQQQIEVSGPIDVSQGQRHLVALVGPTGVGKTTTLAKLAAGFHFDQGIPIGFITLDTFRLGAVDQLQKYADLLGAPCEVVSAPDQMLPALDRLSDCPLILMDTAGRSPRDQSQLHGLAEMLRIAQPTQTHLVLSAASSQTHAEVALEQFQLLSPTHLLLTKLDESTCLGSWYRVLSGGNFPLSYITTGQNVPEDILVANRRRIASLILGQSNHLGATR